MSQRGRPPKPVEQKRLLGNPGKRALPNQASVVALPSAYGIPEPQRPLGPSGSELWERIWGLANTWLSPNTDSELLLMTCELLDERWNLRVRVMRDSRPEERKALRELDRQLVANLSLLGFSPTDRSRLGVAEVKRQSKLEELRTRVEENKQ
jgi:hypothetical protein